MAEFKTLQFPNTPRGQSDKVRALQAETSQGWRVVSETIVPGKFRGGQACCLFLIFMPCAFLAGHKDDIISVTLQRDVAGDTSASARVASYDRAKWAALLQYDADVAAAAGALRSQDPKWTDELAAAYLTLNEKKYLPDIVARISERARAEQEENAALRAREEERNSAMEAQRQRNEQARRQQRIDDWQRLWSTPTRKIVTLSVIAAVILLLILVFTLSTGGTSNSDVGGNVGGEERISAAQADIPPAPSPSYDCDRVRSEVLILVCATPSLAKSDQEMAQTYRLALTKALRPGLLRRNQRNWILRRNNSQADVSLLQTMYADRIAYLKTVAADAGP